MKKLFSVLLAITLVASLFCMPVSATYADQNSTAYIQYGTSAHDLRAYGLHTFRINRLTESAPAIDGVISADEYGGTASDVASIADGGLTLTNGTCTTDYTAEYGEAYKDIKITSYIAFDNEFVYIGEKVEAPAALDVQIYKGLDADGNEILTPGSLNTYVRYGLNQSEAIPEAASRLSNAYEYTFVEDSLRVSGCTSGNRTYKKIDGQVSKSVTLDNEIVGDWTSEKYALNTAVSYVAGENTHTYDFEYKIPLVDVIFSAAGSFDSAAVEELLAKSEFFGSYMFQVAVTRRGGSNNKTQMFLSTGYAGGRELAPYTEGSTLKSTTWGKAVKEYWTNESGESLSIVYVPSPVVYNADPAYQLSEVQAFRPGLTGYAFTEFGSVYKIGEVVTFTVTPDCVDNTAPALGDSRVIPTKFRIRSGYDTKLTGTFDEDLKTAHFDTKELPVGLNTLVVTFTQQKFDGTNWVDVGVSKNISKNFTIAGSVMGTITSASAQTGDNASVFVVAGAAMLLAAATFSFVILGKKRSR